MVADYATLLRDHVTLECRSIDRVFLQAGVPKLQSVGPVCNFLVHRRGYKIPSSAAFGQIGDAYVPVGARARGAVGVFPEGRGQGGVAQPLRAASSWPLDSHDVHHADPFSCAMPTSTT